MRLKSQSIVASDTEAMKLFRNSLVLGSALFAGLLALQAADQGTQIIRATGTIQAIHSLTVQVPVMQGQGSQLTLIKLVQNGAHVHKGDLLAQFDSTTQLKAAREAAAKYDDLAHQVEQKRAEHASNVEKRLSDLQTAQADFSKAEIDLRKSPILSEIDQQKDVIKVADGKEHVASLERSNGAHDTAELAEIRVLELQRDRQKVAVNRQSSNADKLFLRAPIEGMVALQNVWRNGSMGHAEEGDQLWAGGALMQLFDPSSMQVGVAVAEPDGAVLKAGTRAMVHLDAFPDLVLPAHFDSASPVASSSMGNPIKSFNARFTLDRGDVHLMPDLSAAVEIQVKP